MKTFGPKKLNSMYGLKSANLAILPEINQFAGLASPVSAALHFCTQKWTGNGCISFYQSSTNKNYRQNICLVFCHSDPDRSSVYTSALPSAEQWYQLICDSSKDQDHHEVSRHLHHAGISQKLNSYMKCSGMNTLILMFPGFNRY